MSDRTYTESELVVERAALLRKVARVDFAGIILKHESSYSEKPSGRWAWSCSCGDFAEDFGSWESCREYTREHWALKIVEAVTTVPTDQSALARHEEELKAQLAKVLAQRDASLAEPPNSTQWVSRVESQMVEAAAYERGKRDAGACVEDRLTDPNNDYPAPYRFGLQKVRNEILALQDRGRVEANK